MINDTIDAALTVPNTAFNTLNSVTSVPFSAYDFLNGLTGYDLGTASLGVGLMSVAALTDTLPVLGSFDDPVLYPLGTLFLEQASQNRPILDATENVFINKIGGAIRSIIPMPTSNPQT